MKNNQALETHRSRKTGWLRAAVLGADDGIVSTSSLIVGVAAAHSSHQAILLSGVAGLVAGAMSMAAGEYVSVSSQADTEKADLAVEGEELRSSPHIELEELAQIYVDRGVELSLARQVALQLTHHDALAAHARDELGITEGATARPFQAAFASAVSFTVGAALPISMVLFCPVSSLLVTVSVSAIFFLALLGAVSARLGGASPGKGAMRVAFWGSLALAATAGIGFLLGTK